ncbi:MAG TPA: hypothetical protein VFP98_08385 [Candidatus Polarisedimenticolia bacterium]|nr:hypothetical protein [Candidatus Polarisedimenticolia bacterium]
MDGAVAPDPLVDLLLREADWLRRLVRGLVADEQQAEDVVQDTPCAPCAHAPTPEAVCGLGCSGSRAT